MFGETGKAEVHFGWSHLPCQLHMKIAHMRQKCREGKEPVPHYNDSWHPVVILLLLVINARQNWKMTVHSGGSSCGRQLDPRQL